MLTVPAQVALLKTFKWNKVALIHQSIGYFSLVCFNMISEGRINTQCTGGGGGGGAGGKPNPIAHKTHPNAHKTLPTAPFADPLDSAMCFA